MKNLTKQNTFRRANALILVVGVLVLLVLVATAFLTKTQGTRLTAKAQRMASGRSNSVKFIGQSIADDIAQSLFVKPEIPAAGNGVIGSANNRRRLPDLGEPRWSHDPYNPYNFAPYAVIPWTNPPDDFDLVDDGDDGIFDDIGPENPLGGPSFGDARWLRDTEPQRADLRVDVSADLPDNWSADNVDGTPDSFTHWRHLTNLSQSMNSWRVVSNISDIEGRMNVGGLVTDLDVPIEQWPTSRPTVNDGTSLHAVVPRIGFDIPIALGDDVTSSDFWGRWSDWLGLNPSTPHLELWSQSQANDRLPVNFLDLSDLDGDGIHQENGERAIDAFKEGTPRWLVERTLTDTDGDGFTDALWHLSPYEAGANTRQVVAVSITDNAAKLNFNVATRFHRTDEGNAGVDGAASASYALPLVTGEETRGHTPADLALVGQNDDNGETPDNWKVGFLDTPAHSPSWITYGELLDPNTPRIDVVWNPASWDDRDSSSLLDELGIQVTGGYNAMLRDGGANPFGFRNDLENITSHFGRLWYWQLAGRDPLAAHHGFRPYNFEDELELRSVEGNNNQFVASRFENSLNYVNGSPDSQIIRSSFTKAQEAGELRHQLTNSQLVFDNRRKITLYNGTRNDLLPPWLRWDERFYGRYDPDGTEGDLPSGNDYENGQPAPLDPFDPDNYDFITWAQMFPPEVILEASRAFDHSGANANAILSVAENWRAQSNTKLDLREYYYQTRAQGFGGSEIFPPFWWDLNDDGKLTLAERLPLSLLLAMTDAQESGSASLVDQNGQVTLPPARTIVGEASNPRIENMTFENAVQSPYHLTRLVAAGLASNILAYRDSDFYGYDQFGDDIYRSWRSQSEVPYILFDYGGTAEDDARFVAKKELPLSAAVTPPTIGRQGLLDSGTFTDYVSFTSPNDKSTQMLGLEAQPFILETFIAHVHEAKAPEPNGACCLAGCDSESICTEVSEETCLSLLGGLEFHADFSCVDVTCPELVACWACCLPAGNCIEIAQEHCITLGGEYHDGELCCEISCGGACCFDLDVDDLLGCELLSEESCIDQGGEYKGIGIDCISLPCDPEGTCCLVSGSCIDIREAGAVTCSNLGGIFQLGEFCVDQPCGGACCLESGQCTDVTISTCFELSGTYQVGVTCADDPCGGSSEAFGACCLDSIADSANDTSLESGSCVYVSENTCANFGGSYFAGQNCLDIVCFGACCLPKGGCEDVSIRTCEDQLYGEFQGAGTSCKTDSCTPRGGCCVGAECVDVTSAVCGVLGGAYSGDDIFCDSDPCGGAGTPPLGGCCIANNAPLGESIAGICEDLTEAQCSTVGGSFAGLSVLCSTEPCGIGACCITHTPQIPTGSDPSDFWIGFCLEVDALVCYDMGGEYKGDGTLCDLAPCDVRACCIDDFRCEVTTQGFCEELGGDYQGNSLTCTDCVGVPGVIGSCCLLLTGECYDVNEVHCEQLTKLSGADVSDTQWTSGALCANDPCPDPLVGACCLPASTCVVLVASTCDLYGGVYRGNNISCADTLCDSTGACCLGSGSCIDVFSEEECSTLGGSYLGLTTVCADATCTSGTCCLPNGDCVEVWTELFCETVFEGEFSSGTFCGDDPCSTSGSCCLGSGSCIDVTSTTNSSDEVMQSASSECHDLGGSYSGGVFCSSIECGGACCFTAGDDNVLFCEEITRDICINELEGSFQGFGSECSGEPCCDIFEGACCLAATCYEVTEAICTNLAGDFGGISSSCEDGSCSTQACCLPAGVCENILPSTCLSLGGTVGGGSCVEGTCGGVPDSSEIGACCLSDLQLCETVRSATCKDLGGAYIGEDTTCYDSNCPAIFEGACCLGLEGCVTLPQSVCNLIAGIFKGDGTSCCDGICDTGACCLPTGECEETPIGLCDDVSGDYRGDGTLCIDSPCLPVLEGACCLEENFCITITEEACIDKFGAYQGDGSTCGSGPCVTGACCLFDGTCAQMTLALCEALVGTYEGDGVDCADATCAPGPPIVGRCCFDTDQCEDVTKILCNSLGAMWDGTLACSSDPCGPNNEGACCVAEDPCVNVPQTACVEIGGVYQGDGVMCDAGPCIKGACCIITFECTEVTPFTCIELGGEYSGDATLCVDGHCCCVGGESLPGRPDGACCLGIGECVEVTEISCLSLNGIYQGDDSLCGATTCIVGACCLGSSSCMEVSEAFCLANGGVEYFGDNTLCSDCGNQCVIEVGACCLPTGQCKELNEFSCNDLEGQYWGDGTNCDPSPCGLGACCVTSGSCLMVVESDACDTINGTYMGDGVKCGSSTCEPYYLVTADTDDCPQETVAVVQLANPFDRPIDLNDYTVEFFGQRFDLSSLPADQQILYPATPENPVTLILYAMPTELNSSIPKQETSPIPIPQFKMDWIDFLDIHEDDHPSDTIIQAVDENAWRTTRDWYDDLSEESQHAVALYKSDLGQLVLVDRLDRPDETNTFSKRVVVDMEDEWNKIDQGTPDDFSDDKYIDTEIIVDDPDNPHDVLFVQWDRATRAWGVDVPRYRADLDRVSHNGLYDTWERNPRYVFSARDQIRSLDAYDIPSSSESDEKFEHASIFSWKWELGVPEDPDDMNGDDNLDGGDDDMIADDPDPWFTVETWSFRGDSIETNDGEIAGGLRNRKPTYFDMNRTEDSLFPDKGWYGQSRVEVVVEGADRFVKPAPLGVKEGALPAHAYATEKDDGTFEWTFAANPAFLDLDLLLDDDPSTGIWPNELVGQDLDGDGEFGEAETDMALSFPLQMLQKDGDFEQVGEVLNCWLMGHMIEGQGVVGEDGDLSTFNPADNDPDAGDPDDVNEYLHIIGGPMYQGSYTPISADIHDTGTVVTFSEFMYPRMKRTGKSDDPISPILDADGNYEWDWWAPITSQSRLMVDPNYDVPDTPEIDAGRTEFYLDAKVNRLRFDQGDADFGIAGTGETYQTSLPMMLGGQLGWDEINSTYTVDEYPWSRLSAAGRVLDLFVCDGPARLGGSDLEDDAIGQNGPEQTVMKWFSFYNANGFTGKATPGMININTATVEAMRALPHMNKIVHATQNANVDPDDSTDFSISGDVNPRSLVPESIVQWREKYNGDINQIDGTGYVGGPDYDDLNNVLEFPDDSRIEETRGFASVGEIGLLMSGSSIDSNSNVQVVTEPWDSSNHQAKRSYDSWRIDYAGLEPFSYDGSGNEDYIGSGYGAKISTDVNSRYYGEHNLMGDRVSGDSEELNMLQAGISNLITTTSDVFTVHMRIRTFRKNPITNVWDGTDLDYIIDDSRYVMLVDRSQVNTPQDKPKILYFEKLPN